MIQFDSLTAGYGKKTVLRGVTFSLNSNGPVALVGPNGAGKSTLLKVLSGQVQPQSGRISIQGEDLTSLSGKARARRVSIVPQEETSVFEFTSKEVVLMGRYVHSLTTYETAEDHEAVLAAMKRVDCEEFSSRMLGSLSGGERQRVLFARALAQGGDVLLLDEPVSFADPSHQLVVGQMVSELAKEGKTILVATHDLNWALRWCSHAVALVAGQVVASGTAGEVLSPDVLREVFHVEYRLVPGDPPGLMLQ